MTRQKLQLLAEARVREARAMLNAGEWSGAYTTVGYAVEFGLKACIAKLAVPDLFPDKSYAAKCHTHEPEKLIDLAGLTGLRAADIKANRPRGKSWLSVAKWDVSARYEIWVEADARELFEAVEDPVHGALAWIRLHW